MLIQHFIEPVNFKYILNFFELYSIDKVYEMTIHIGCLQCHLQFVITTGCSFILSIDKKVRNIKQLQFIIISMYKQIMSPIIFAAICRNMLSIAGSINVKSFIQQRFYIIDDSRTYSEDYFSAYLIDLQPRAFVKKHVSIIKVIRNPISVIVR